MKNNIFHSAAWHEFAETEIETKHWGSNVEKGLLPYQVAYKEKLGGWIPNFEGLPLEEIIRSSEEAKVAQFQRDCFYFPNTLETVKRKGRYEEHESGRRVAVYRWIVLDIDCKSESDRLAAYDRIQEFPIPYSMLVTSGNGFHVYWEIKPIHAVMMEVEPRHKLEMRIDRLIKSFCARLGGDNTKASYLGHAMRVPGTWNLKDPNQPLQCKILDKNSRVYRFDEIEQLAKEAEVYIKMKPGRKRRPKRQPKAFVAKVIGDHLRLTRQVKMAKHVRRYLELILQFKSCRYFVEGTTNRNVLGSDGKRIVEARQYFLKNGYIEIEKRGNRLQRQATRYRLTRKFYDDFGFPKQDESNWKHLSEVRQRLGETDVKATKRRQFQARAYRELRNAGADHEEAANLILEVLAKRSCGPRHSEVEVRKDLEFLGKRFVPLKAKS